MKSISIYNGRRLSPLDSIRHYCLWCCGYSRQEVASCSANTCSLFPYRLGTILPGAPRNVVKVIKRKCEDCLPMGAAECDAFQAYEIHPPCPIWPFRLGGNPHYGDGQRKKLQKHGKERGFGTGSQTSSAPTIHPGGEDGPKEARAA